LGALEALMPTYSKSFKSNIVKKITNPNGIRSVALSKERNIPYATIRRWVRTYGATTMSENQAKANKR
jgi:transposase-like protein